VVSAPNKDAFETKQNSPNHQIEQKTVEKKMSDLELDPKFDDQSQIGMIQIVKAETKIRIESRPNTIDERNLVVN
jgi:hypothetical protein